jgi:DNA-binding IclR family transcriptional regulator
MAKTQAKDVAETLTQPRMEKGTAIDNAIELLKTLSRAKTALGVNEIARRVLQHKSTVSRTLRTLENHGIVERDLDNGRFRLGVGLMTLAAPLFESLDVIRVARPVLRKLAESSGETASLYMWDGEMAISVDKELGAHAIQHFAPPGRRIPAHATAAGKAFLSALDETVLGRIIEAGLPSYTAKTITTADAFRRDIRRSRKRGFSINRQEYEDDVSAVGAPVLGVRDQAVAAIAITAPSFRFGGERETELCRLIVDGASEISRRLGYVAK